MTKLTMAYGRNQDAAQYRFSGFRTRFDVFHRALLGDPPAHVQPMTVRLQPGARAVWAKPRASRIVHIPGDENCWGGLLSRWVTRLGGAVCVHASVKYTEALFAGNDKFPTKKIVRGVKAAAAEGGPTPVSYTHLTLPTTPYV